MANKITVDTSDLQKGLARLDNVAKDAFLHGVNDIADEILRLSMFEVAHDTGRLQASGHVEPESDKSVIVGYNTVYAARLHEHPEYRFQKGRKGKYLEDPIKNNLSVFIKYMAGAVGGVFK
jgi:hypothetical protein